MPVEEVKPLGNETTNIFPLMCHFLPLSPQYSMLLYVTLVAGNQEQNNIECGVRREMPYVLHKRLAVLRVFGQDSRL